MQHKVLLADDFAAFVGIDWADAKHDVCLQAAGSAERESSTLAHRPEAIDEWVRALRQRFQGKPIAIGLELSKGPIVSALRKYEFLVLFPINPLTLARYREAFTPSQAKTTLATPSCSWSCCSNTVISSTPVPEELLSSSP